MYSERWSDMDCVKIGDLVGGRFRITSVVGAGSFAWVFVAQDLHSGQTVALKMLRPERFGDDDVLQRFESRELRLLERIEHAGHSPFVVRLLEKRLLRHDGLPYLVLEYVDGPSLQEWLTLKGQLDIKEVARIGAGLARGLSVIHAAGGVHRDLKPSNVRMRNGKTPVLVDLGIARAMWETQKLTQGTAPLTPKYAAPEQRRGLPATSAADVYALGVCLHEMLLGQTRLSSRMAKLVNACLAVDPRERPTLQHIVQELDGFVSSRVARPAIWPLVFISGCAVFPGHTLGAELTTDAAPCVPLAGLVRNSVRHEGTSTSTTFEWSQLDKPGDPGMRITVTLPEFDAWPYVILDDEAPGRYEILGWFGETCRHFAVQACEDRATVRELPACALARPVSYGKSGMLQGDVNNDGIDDVITYGQLPSTPDKPVSIPGTTMLRYADGTSRILENAFDLSSIDAYHIDAVRRTGDIDRDGCADIVMTTYPNGGACPSSVHVLFGDCQGTFSIVKDVAFVPLPINRSDLGDVDEDGFLDLVTGPDDDGDPGQSFLLRGNGLGFGEAEQSIDAHPDIESGRDQPGFGFVTLEDANGDGHIDVLLSAYKGAPGVGNNESVYLLHHGHGDGTFEQTSSFAADTFQTQKGFGFLPTRGR